MIVSVQDELSNIIEVLKSKGYETYRFSDNKASDIYIYSQSITGLTNLYNNISPVDGGSFILNVDNMNMDDIIKCISNRTYTRIF